MATRKSPEHREQKRVVAPFDSEVEQGRNWWPPLNGRWLAGVGYRRSRESKKERGE